MAQTKYSPHEHAAELGIQIHYHNLKTDNGLWIPALNVILLRPRMRVALERSVCGHEVGHSVLGHSDTSAKSENTANRYAADRLIDADALLDLMKWRPEQPALWSDELEVSHQLLRVYLNVHKLAS